MKTHFLRSSTSAREHENHRISEEEKRRTNKYASDYLSLLFSSLSFLCFLWYFPHCVAILGLDMVMSGPYASFRLFSFCFGFNQFYII